MVDLNKKENVFTIVNIVIALVSLGVIVSGFFIMLSGEGQTSSGPMAVSDSCCIGFGWILGGGVIGVVALILQTINEKVFSDFNPNAPTYNPQGGKVVFVAESKPETVVVDEDVESFDNDHRGN